MPLLIVNAGSSSLKLALYEEETVARKAAVAVERIGSTGTKLLIQGFGRSTKHNVRANDHAGVRSVSAESS
jgi:acetate kinase